jgi:NTE family protein
MASGDPKPVLVLQGGGALGSYQAGVYEALNTSGVRPEWVAGISIGAVNGAIIAGNPPEKRVERLQEFWGQVAGGWGLAPFDFAQPMRAMLNGASAAWGAAMGVSGLYAPRFPPTFWQPPGTEAALSFYDSAPLRQSLERLVDFDRINSGDVRLSVGAVNIETGNFAYFDNTRQKIGPEHIMASGALPPGLPPVQIDGCWYWDGGLVSNTPLEYVLETDHDDDLLIFQVDLFSARGPMPGNIIEAAEREKDIRYSSRTRLNTDANLRIHRLKTALRALIDSLPAEYTDDPNVNLLKELSQENAVTVVQLIYRRKAYECSGADFEFSRQTMLDHWAAGIGDVNRWQKRHARGADTAPPQGTKVLDPGKEEPA